MNFQLTKEQEFVRKMVREFALTEVEPLAADIDKEHRFPVETVEKMAKYGLLGVPFPTEVGGAGEITSHMRSLLKSFQEYAHQLALSAQLTLHSAAGLSSSMVNQSRRQSISRIFFQERNSEHLV